MKRAESSRAAQVGAPWVLERRLPSGVDPAHALAAAARIGIDLRLVTTGPVLLLGRDDTLAHALRVAAALAPATLDRVGAVPPALAARVGVAHGRSSGVLRLGPDGRVTLSLPRAAPIDLGEPAEALAVLARRALLREAEASAPLSPLSEETIAKAREVLFGPPRTLSDPSSRRVLEAFGVRTAPHRLAETAARAAAHARALRGSVDLRLASPDLNALDHPELGALDLRTPGEVREAQRSLLRVSREQRADARVLGVTVSAHVPAALRLEVGRATLSLRHLGSPGGELAGPVEGPLPTTLVAAATALALSRGAEVLATSELTTLLARVGAAVAALPELDALTMELGAPSAPLVVAARVWVGRPAGA